LSQPSLRLVNPGYSYATYSKLRLDCSTFFVEYISLISSAVTKVLHNAPPQLKIDVRVHVTRKSNTNLESALVSSERDDHSSSGRDSASEKIGFQEPSDGHTGPLRAMLEHSVVKLNFGRPDIPQILKEQADTTCSQRMGVAGTHVETEARLFI
jgi:hypothetical protein